MRTRKEILNHIVYVGKQNLPQGGRLILYGSQARGTATDASDWDLLIILDKPKIEQSDYDNVSFPFTALGWDLGQLISPVLYTKEEWDNNSFTPFYKNVQQDAIYLILPVSPGASGMQPRDPCRPWRGTLSSGHKPR